MKKIGKVIGILALAAACGVIFALSVTVVGRFTGALEQYKGEISQAISPITRTLHPEAAEETAAAEETEAAEAAETVQETAPLTIPATGDTPHTATGSEVLFGDYSGIVEEFMPSAVAVTSTLEVTQYSFFSFGMPQTYEGEASGSGIIIGENDDEFLVVTNNHVVEDAKTMSVVFADDEAVAAQLKGRDPETDIAILAVKKADMKESTRSAIRIATIGDSDSLKVGQSVIAIGNALGYGQSVTAGIISAIDREALTEGQYTGRKLLQTDAAINKGNSGGALINLKGEVIGINSAKLSGSSVEGMGYAIPISTVQDIIANLSNRETKEVVEEEARGYLGIQGQSIDSVMSQAYDMPVGVYIYKIIEGSAAENSELREKDIITAVDGQAVRNMEDLQSLLTYYKAGETITVTVSRLDGEAYSELSAEVTLSDRKIVEKDQ